MQATLRDRGEDWACSPLPPTHTPLPSCLGLPLLLPAAEYSLWKFTESWSDMGSRMNQHSLLKSLYFYLSLHYNMTSTVGSIFIHTCFYSLFREINETELPVIYIKCDEYLREHIFFFCPWAEAISPNIIFFHSHLITTLKMAAHEYIANAFNYTESFCCRHTCLLLNREKY